MEVLKRGMHAEGLLAISDRSLVQQGYAGSQFKFCKNVTSVLQLLLKHNDTSCLFCLADEGVTIVT